MKMAVEDQFTIQSEDCANIKLREVTIAIAIWKIALNLMHKNGDFTVCSISQGFAIWKLITLKIRNL